MRTIVFSALLFLFISCSFGQDYNFKKVKIIDSVSSSHIPYATIKFNSTETFTADENGIIEIREDLISNALSATIYCIGYEKMQITLNKNSQEIKLKPVVYTLKEIVVTADNGVWTSRKIGNLKKKPTRSGYMYRTGHRVALKIENPQTIHTVTKILFYITKGQTPQTKFRAIIYEIDTVTDLPGNILIPENIIMQAQKGNEWVSYDISKYNFSIPPQGCYVAMEWLPESKQDEYNYSKTQYEPQIVANGQIIGATRSKKKEDLNKFALYWSDIEGWFKSSGNLGIFIPGIQCEILEKANKK